MLTDLVLKIDILACVFHPVNHLRHLFRWYQRQQALLAVPRDADGDDSETSKRDGRLYDKPGKMKHEQTTGGRDGLPHTAALDLVK